MFLYLSPHTVLSMTVVKGVKLGFAWNIGWKMVFTHWDWVFLKAKKYKMGLGKEWRLQ